MSVEILYSDPYCICVSKPHKVLVHHAHFSRFNKDELSLVQRLEQQYGQKYYPVHRLDRSTSGILLLAAKRDYVADFQLLFDQRSIEKTYFAVVRGFAPEYRIIETPVKARGTSQHKEAYTELYALDTTTLNIPVKPYGTSRYSLVKLIPKTGRMHQLRIHMKKISHPIIGDGKYGDYHHDTMYKEQFGWNNLFLHAGSLAFIHPFTQDGLNIQAPFSKNWLQLFKKFDWKNPFLN